MASLIIIIIIIIVVVVVVVIIIIVIRCLRGAFHRYDQGLSEVLD